jgi:hypothetical protein
VVVPPITGVAWACAPANTPTSVHSMALVYVLSVKYTPISLVISEGFE